MLAPSIACLGDTKVEGYGELRWKDARRAFHLGPWSQEVLGAPRSPWTIPTHPFTPPRIA